MSHTPGPWRLHPQAVNHQTLTGQGPGLIADIHRDEGARLIAQAPALLGALQALADAVDAYTTNPGDWPELAVARAAIAAATQE